MVAMRLYFTVVVLGWDVFKETVFEPSPIEPLVAVNTPFVAVPLIMS